MISLHRVHAHGLRPRQGVVDKDGCRQAYDRGGPPEGKEHRTPKRYFEDVLEGSRIVATQCAQDIILE